MRMLNTITGRLATFIPVIREKDEGLWWLIWDKDEQGPYPDEQSATDDAPAILVCDACYSTLTGCEAECQDGCNLPLDHDGVCQPYGRDGKTDCDMCGITGRLTALGLAEVLEVAEGFAGLWS